MPFKPLPADGIVEYSTTVVEAWLDYNDHMNVAYYVAAFDLGIDAFKDTIGISVDYVAERKRSTVALEAHITYQREAVLGETLRVCTRVIDFDGKRSHLFQEMFRDADLLATQETLAISFDTGLRKTCPFEPDIAARYEAMQKAQSSLPRPRYIGRSVGIKRAKPGGGS